MTQEPDDTRAPLDAGLAAAFGRDRSPTEAPRSVLTELADRLGGASPRVSLAERDAGESPVIDPGSEERLNLPRGRGTYQLMGEIARGGMGVVLKGHDTDLGRDVALKVLHKDFAGRPEVLQRFVEEAQIGGQLQHPGIVPVYELGLMADERPYFTMKLVKGHTLAMLLAERSSSSTSRRSLLNVFESVCQTVAYAHSRGVIHRDLKPANVMVGAFGEVQVVDWGLAKVLARGGVADERKAKEARRVDTVLETVRSSTREGSGSSQSIVGSVMGTPAYMSPEQAQGQVDRLDERSDVFSLGAILCEILTGHPPYSSDGGEDRTLTNASLGRTEVALERLAACDADTELVDLARECLLVSREARPAHAGVLAARVQDHLSAVEERAHAAAVDAAVQRRGRKLTVALAGTIVVALVAAGGAWATVQRNELDREREVTRRDREIEGEVNTALVEASRLRGQELFGEAHAALERADLLAQGSRAGDDLQVRILAERERVEESARTARERETTRRENAEFFALLDGVERQRTRVFRTPEDIDRSYVEAFRSLGLDVDRDPAAQVAQGLRERGIGDELIPSLDRWLALRGQIAGDTRTGDWSDNPRLRLVDLLHAFDGDPLRADLREAMLNLDVDMLRELARGDLEQLSPSTHFLLTSALQFAGDEVTSAEVVRESVRIHPGDFSLQAWAARTYDAPERVERLRIAQALRPKDVRILQEISNLYRELGARARWRGEDERARALNRSSAEELVRRIELTPDDVGEHAWLAEVYLETGDLEDARESALLALEHLFQVFPGDPTVADLEQHRPVLLGIMLRNAGLLDEAERVFSLVADAPELIPRISERAVFHRVLTRSLQRARAGDADGAVAVLREALARDESFDRLGLALHFGVWTRAELHRMVDATDADRQRLADPALDALVHEARGAMADREKEIRLLWSAILRGLAEDWPAVLEQAEPVVPRDEVARTLRENLLALAHHHLGNPEAARDHLEAGSAYRPGLVDEQQFLYLTWPTVAVALRDRARKAIDG